MNLFQLLRFVNRMAYSLELQLLLFNGTFLKISESGPPDVSSSELCMAAITCQCESALTVAIVWPIETHTVSISCAATTVATQKTLKKKREREVTVPHRKIERECRWCCTMSRWLAGKPTNRWKTLSYSIVQGRSKHGANLKVQVMLQRKQFC